MLYSSEFVEAIWGTVNKNNKLPKKMYETKVPEKTKKEDQEKR